jgi:hypothetical protein
MAPYGSAFISLINSHISKLPLSLNPYNFFIKLSISSSFFDIFFVLYPFAAEKGDDYSICPKPRMRTLIVSLIITIFTVYPTRAENSTRPEVPGHCKTSCGYNKGLNTYVTLVLCDLYFLPPQFYFLSNLVPVVYEKMEMVPPSNFSSKTNVQSRHPTGVGVHARHLSPSTPQPSYVLMKIHIITFSYLKKREI